MSVLCLQLLEANRRRVLAADDTDFWKDIVIDLMSGEEGGTFKGSWVSRVDRVASVLSQPLELFDLRAELQARPEAWTQTSAHWSALPPNTHDPEMAKKDRHIRVRRDAHFEKT